MVEAEGTYGQRCKVDTYSYAMHSLINYLLVYCSYIHNSAIKRCNYKIKIYISVVIHWRLDTHM